MTRLVVPEPSGEPVSLEGLEWERDPPDRHEVIGQQFANRYTVRARIGGGGMADVYRATDEQLGIDVAIKVLKPGLASAELRARMVREARAAAQVRHPNLVRVFGVGTQGATAFIVMELVAGLDLDQHLRARPDQRLPWRDALALLVPVIEALHAVHEQGFVHRDIKPGNILVCERPGCPASAVVIDLGLVKVDPALRATDRAPSTGAGRLLCTPGYESATATRRPRRAPRGAAVLACTLGVAAGALGTRLGGAPPASSVVTVDAPMSCPQVRVLPPVPRGEVDGRRPGGAVEGETGVARGGAEVEGETGAARGGAEVEGEKGAARGARSRVRAARRQALVEQTPTIQRCVNLAGGGQVSARVLVDVDRRGRATVELVGAATTPLGRCLALTSFTLPAGPAERFIHTFTLRGAPRR